MIYQVFHSAIFLFPLLHVFFHFEKANVIVDTKHLPIH